MYEYVFGAPDQDSRAFAEMAVMVTGASGFVGLALCQYLSHFGYDVVAATRKRCASLPAQKHLPPGKVSMKEVGNLSASTDWSQPLESVDVVVHLAARVHVMHETASDPLDEFRMVNLAATMNLARQAASRGIRRFIYISSIKVNGESTLPGQFFHDTDVPMPVDPYAVSKHEAELGLHQLASETGMEVVVIRPPLVYGPGVKANFLHMMRWLYSGTPLPLGSIYNKRSLVALDNLVDLIGVCIRHPAAANQTFLIADGEDLSTTELLLRVGRALDRPARLIPVPAWLLQAGAVLAGKRAVAQRLCGSLRVDICKSRELLGWAPPVSVDEALSGTARHFLESQRK